MGEHFTAPQFTGMSCDTRGCTASKITEPLALYGVDRDEFVAEAVAEGWTIWAGRTRRTYCPAHQPKGKHKMRLVSGKSWPTMTPTGA